MQLLFTNEWLRRKITSDPDIDAEVGIMEQAQRAMRPDEPLMVAWKSHEQTDEFANTLKWAGEANMGQLWACFVAGWKAAGGVIDPH